MEIMGNGQNVVSGRQEISLRCFSACDQAFFASLASDERVVRFVGDGMSWPTGRIEERVRLALRDVPASEAGAVRWFIAEADGESVGLFVSSRRQGAVEIGYWVAPDFWGRGIAGAMLDAGLEAVVRVYGPVAVVALIDPANTASVKLVERRGFVVAFLAAKGRYGHRRIHAVLTGPGCAVAKKTVLTPMRTLGLVCKVRRRRRYSSYAGQVGTCVPNTLGRDFAATGPNQKWVTDVTEFRIGDRRAYLSPVIDLFDRSVVAHRCGTSPSLELTNGSLEQALATLAPD